MRRNSLHLRKSLIKPEVVRSSVDLDENLNACSESDVFQNNCNNDPDVDSDESAVEDQQVDLSNGKFSQSGRLVRPTAKLKDSVV